MQHERVTILVSSAGTGSAITVINALKNQDQVPVNLWACDADPSAPGLFLANHRILAPSIAEPSEYLSFFQNLAKTIGPYCLIPTLSREIAMISAWQNQLEAEGVRTLLPPDKTVQLCDDKTLFSSFCTLERIAAPRLLSADAMEYPVFIKPRIGSGSKGSGAAHNYAEAKVLLSMAKDPIIQEFITGPEVTVDVLCKAGGEPVVISARQRTCIKNGQSVKGSTIPADPFVQDITRICQRLEMQGPCNFQFILNPERGPVLIEVNPRFAAGGLGLSVHAGANIPLLAVKLMMKYTISESECRPRIGVNMTKYWSEVFWENPR